jgi:hypothetical protein
VVRRRPALQGCPKIFVVQPGRDTTSALAWAVATIVVPLVVFAFRRPRR